MALAHHDPAEQVLITRGGRSEITIRPEPPAAVGRAPAVFPRLDAPPPDASAAAYFTPEEARALAEALLRAAASQRPVAAWRAAGATPA
jgi:hypothetical protein